jgi:hypothetical protein
MNRRLFIPDHDIGKFRGLLKRLPEPGQVPMPENSGTAREKGMLNPIPFHILIL